MGLSFPTLAKSNSVPFFDNVMNHKILKHNVFSLFLSEGDLPSNILFGEIEKNNMLSNFTFVDVVSKVYWEIEIEDIFVGKEKTVICDDLRKETGKCGVAIDSGTSLYAGPTE